MSNVYDILFKEPGIEVKEIPPALEIMARSLVASGRLRVEADERHNFIRFTIASENTFIMFSKRELFDPKLIGGTEEILKASLSRKFRGAELETKTKKEISRLKSEINKYPEVGEEIEIKLARLLVQAAHPSVIKLLLLENAEVFISFSYNIAELLDIQSWQTVGGNSGMQSTDGYHAAVFVSCGGNPFLYGDKRVYTTDGFPALARMMVIAGQELGHYSDIIRDKKGRMAGRHSVNARGTKATDKTAKARKDDIKRVKAIRKKLLGLGLAEIVEIERHIEFYKKHRKRSWILLKTKIQAHFLMKKFVEKCLEEKIKFVGNFPHKKPFATNLFKCINDMEDNLTPDADVYKRDNPVHEEAIACVEALARVPQQAIKWGKEVTGIFMPNLYKIYYEDVIPACEEAVGD